MWPFDIFRKRRERLEQERRAKRDEAYRRELELQQALFAYRNARAAPMPKASSSYTDPISPLSPLSPIQQAAMWSAPADEPRQSHGHCSSSGTHSSSDYGSSHSSSYDSGCSSSSSSYDSGSSSSSSDW